VLDLPEMTDWQDSCPPISVESDVYDKVQTQRVYASPFYNTNGDMVCRACGGMMARAMGKNGTGTAVCSNTGCPAHGFEFVEGSFFSNPGRIR
jgi:hypothetical protein